jgi:phosphatidylglycerophosphate synthase
MTTPDIPDPYAAETVVPLLNDRLDDGNGVIKYENPPAEDVYTLDGPLDDSKSVHDEPALSDAYPDVATEKSKPRTFQQRLADKTHGILTGSNAITLLKSAAVKYGSDRMDTWLGLIIVGVARSGDIADGAYARAFGVSSDFGEKLDHGLDKVEIGYMSKKAIEKGLVPEGVIAYILGHNALNAAITLAATADGVKLTAKKPNKYGIFGECSAIGVYAGAELAERGGHDTAAGRLRMFGHAIMVPTVALGIKGTQGLVEQWQQGREARQAKTQS